MEGGDGGVTCVLIDKDNANILALDELVKA